MPKRLCSIPACTTGKFTYPIPGISQKFIGNIFNNAAYRKQIILLTQQWTCCKHECTVPWQQMSRADSDLDMRSLTFTDVAAAAAAASPTRD